MILVVPEPAATLLAVAAYSGARRSEIAGLQWPDYRDRALHISRSITNGVADDPKARASAVPIPVVPYLAALLDAHRERLGNPTSGPMFPAGNGEPVSLKQRSLSGHQACIESLRSVRENQNETRKGGSRFQKGCPFSRVAGLACFSSWSGYDPARLGYGRQNHSNDTPTLGRIRDPALLHQDVTRANHCSHECARIGIVR
jgi:hypothetical protein